MDTLVCSTCKETKPVSDFTENKSKARRFHYSCKKCMAHKAMLRRRSKPLKEEQKEMARIRSSEWRKNNSSRNKQIKKDWRLRNSDVKNAANARRRASKLNATPDWLTEEDLTQIKYLYEIARDAKILTGEDYHVDHIVPLKGNDVCGLHVPWNLQVLPAAKNLSKGNRHEN